VVGSPDLLAAVVESAQQEMEFDPCGRVGATTGEWIADYALHALLQVARTRVFELRCEVFGVWRGRRCGVHRITDLGKAGAERTTPARLLGKVD
jgi:hypothetical protein